MCLVNTWQRENKVDGLYVCRVYTYKETLNIAQCFRRFLRVRVQMCVILAPTAANIVSIISSLLFLYSLHFFSWQVLNQTSRLEIQMLENSLSTNKLEKELMVQTNEISKLHDKNR